MGPVPNGEAHTGIQKDLDEMHGWVTTWKLRLNYNKCRVTHFGCHNECQPYTLGDPDITTGIEERDLGLTADADLKWSSHCALIAKKANQRLGMLRQGRTG